MRETVFVYITKNQQYNQLDKLFIWNMINQDAESIYSTIHQDITPYWKDLLQNCYKIRKRVLPNTLLLKPSSTCWPQILDLINIGFHKPLSKDLSWNQSTLKACSSVFLELLLLWWCVFLRACDWAFEEVYGDVSIIEKIYTYLLAK